MLPQAQEFWKTYGHFAAVQGLSIAAPPGSTFASMGASGAGILTPTRGSATVLGVDSRAVGPQVLQHVGYVSENQELPGQLRVRDCFDYMRPCHPRWDRKLEGALCDQLRLPGKRRIRHLSHGMPLKMALACDLSFRLRLLVLDEPSSGLDVESRLLVMPYTVRSFYAHGRNAGPAACRLASAAALDPFAS